MTRVPAHTFYARTPTQASDTAESEIYPEVGMDVPVIKERFHTVLETQPMYSTQRLHENYIDCVRYFGYVCFFICPSMQSALPHTLRRVRKRTHTHLLLHAS